MKRHFNANIPQGARYEYGRKGCDYYWFYDRGAYSGVAQAALKGLSELEPADADAGEVARAPIVATPFKRLYRVFVDPSQDGAEEVFRVGDRMRREMFHTIGLSDLLAPKINN